MRSTLGRLAVSALVVLLATACAPAADEAGLPEALSPAEREQIEQMILSLSNEWAAGMVTGDLSVLDRILAPDFIYTVDSGSVHTRASFIALLSDAPVTYTSFEVSDVSVRWYADNVVVITGIDTSTWTDADGNEGGGSGAFTNVYVQRDGEWQCVVGHSTDVVQ